jgi:hypothetical protein
MPTKRSDKPAEPTATYVEWKTRCAAMLDRQRISPGVLRERDWRRLYIKGATPEKAVDRAQTHYWNSPPPFERTRPKRGPG